MARPLSELQAIMAEIEDVLQAYIQPPPGALEYPCIMIERGGPSSVNSADNLKYHLKKAYTITVIDRAPDSLIPDRVEGLEHCQFIRYFKTDGLHHHVFQLFF